MAQTMNETLQIKITADTSGLTAGVKKVKQDLQGIKKDAGTLGGATAGTNASMEQLAETMEQVRNMSVFEILRESLKGVKDKLQLAGSQFKNFKEEVATAFDFEALKEGLDTNENTILGLASSMKVQLGESAKSVGAAFKNLGGAIKGVLTSSVVMVGAAIAAFAALIAQIRLTIRTAQELAQVTADAAKIGLSVQAYQEWSYVLESVGVQADELTGLIKTLSDEQAQMAEGAEGASKAFDQLGLKAGDVVRMSQEELFTETITRLQEIESQTEKTRIAYQIFGEDAAHVANVMSLSGEQMKTLVENYRALGGGASQELINKSNTLNMSLSNLRQAWRGLTNSLSELFMPIINSVVKWLTRVIVVVRMLIQTIFGLSSTAASGSGSMTSGMNGYTGATNKATKAVEKLKRAQMGFDELNVLPGKDTSGGGGSDAGLDFGGGMPGGGFELPKMEDLGLGKIRAWFEEYKYLIQDLTTWGLITVGLGMMIAGALAWNPILMLKGAGLAGIGLALGNTEGGTFSRLSAELQAIMGVISGIAKGLISLIGGLLDIIVAVIKGIIEGILQSVTVIKDAIKLLVQSVADVINGVLTMIGGFIELAVGAFTGNTELASEGIKNILNGFLPFLTGVIRGLLAIAAGVASPFVMIFIKIWDNIKAVFAKWKPFFSDLWTKITAVFKDMGAKVGDVFGGAVKGVINSILNSVEKTLNKFVGLINGAIEIINKIPGVNVKKLSVFNIPRLATGGIATRSTLANIGEAGAEAVLPLENNTQWMDTLADKIAARNGAPSKIVLMVDGKELGWASINGINNITKQTGNLQLQLI